MATAHHAYTALSCVKRGLATVLVASHVYLVSGMHHCLNVDTALHGRPVAFLIRALEPVSGHNTMRAARAAGSPSLSAPAELRDGAPA